MENLQPTARHYATVFLLSLSLLMLEIAVARILSVALFSHYAFVAISLAMFGLGLSGLVVYLLPEHFNLERVDEQLVAYAWRCGLAAALSVVVFLRIHVAQELSLRGFLTLSLAYGVLALPFFFGGVCVSLLMTHFSSRIGRIYWADLIGASLGCLATVLGMQILPAPKVAVLVGLIAAGTSLGVGMAAKPRRVGTPALALAVVAGLVLLGQTTDLLRMRYVKTWTTFYSDYAGWNAFSRVSAFASFQNAARLLPLKNPPQDYADDEYPKSMELDIDGAAWTPMTNFDGDLSKLQFLRQSVLYVAHHLKPGADVLIIGTGGGRDILAAKVFGQPHVLGIEINPLMRYMVQDRYADYSGRPYTLPGVRVVIDEARSRLSTLDRRFDVIQLSLIDTFSLNAAGGFVFSENYLYTTEAFQTYFRHLKDDGVLTISRYLSPVYPLEMLKIVGMAREAWAAEGVADPSRQIAVLSQPSNATMIAKRTPFTPQELQLLDRVASENNMQVLYRPGTESGGMEAIRRVLTTPDPEAYYASFPFLIDPPTDDKPFFFHFLRGRLAAGDVPGPDADPFQFLRQWNEAVKLLYLLIGVVTAMAALFFFGPLLLLAGRRKSEVPAATAAPLLLYFGCLGYGFMMIEVPLLQRFVLFLGYPVYALAVVLFSLLLFSGTGSLLSTRFRPPAQVAVRRVLAAIVVLAAAYVWLVPQVIEALLGEPIAARIAVTVVLLMPIGLLLGMPYPLGITVLRGFSEHLVPWAWGLNGALSVVASVLAIFIGSRIGFSMAFLTGVAAYAVGLGALSAVDRPSVRARSPARAAA
jgi:hypothetical protein